MTKPVNRSLVTKAASTEHKWILRDLALRAWLLSEFDYDLVRALDTKTIGACDAEDNWSPDSRVEEHVVGLNKITTCSLHGNT